MLAYLIWAKGGVGTYLTVRVRSVLARASTNGGRVRGAVSRNRDDEREGILLGLDTACCLFFLG